jgi:hypothetical protein
MAKLDPGHPKRSSKVLAVFRIANGAERAAGVEA